jgi:hypothetical protein
MTHSPDYNEHDTAPAMPAWARGMHVTKEQLAAAQRTREYHVRRLQSMLKDSEFGAEYAQESDSREPRQEH